MKKLFILLAVFWAASAQAQYSISQLPPATVPLTGAELFPCTQLGATKKCLTGSVTAAANAAFILQTANAGLPLSRTLVGTANEVLLADGGPLGNLVLSTPQPIAATSAPSFAGLTLSGALSGTSATFSTPLGVPSGGTGVNSLTGLVFGNGASAMSPYAGTSCTSQFVRALNASGGATCNTVANTDLANSSFTLNGASVSLGGTRTLSLASVDFANQGTTTTVLHGNAAGNPAFSAVSLTADVSNVLPTANGGTSFGTYTLGDLLYSSATNTLAKLAGNTTATKNFLTQTGNGAVSAAPVWGTIAAADLPGTFSGFANPSGLIGLTAVNGAATTATRSDATHALDQSIGPTWTGVHTFSAAPLFNAGFSGGTAVNASVAGNLSNASTGAAAVVQYTLTNNLGTDFALSLNGGSSTFAACGNCLNVGDTVTIRAGGSGGAISIATVNSERIRVGNTGAITINAPTSGIPLTITSNTTSVPFTVQANTTAGSSQGPVIKAGTNSTDRSFDLANAGNTLDYLAVRGDGEVQMPALAQTSVAQTGTICWSSTRGQLTIDTTVACLASTRRVKQNVRPLESGLSEVMRMSPVSYDLRPEFDTFHAGRQIGLIAEEVADVDPRLVALDNEGDPRGVRYMQMTALLVKSIQQQQIEIYALVFGLIGSFAFTYSRTRKAV